MSVYSNVFNVLITANVIDESLTPVTTNIASGTAANLHHTVPNVILTATGHPSSLSSAASSSALQQHGLLYACGDAH